MKKERKLLGDLHYIDQTFAKPRLLYPSLQSPIFRRYLTMLTLSLTLTIALELGFLWARWSSWRQQKGRHT